MDIRKLSEEERKKFIEGFKEYVANRNGNGSNDNQTVNNIIDYAADDAVNNTFTRRNYNTDTMWNQVQNVANNYNQNKTLLWDNIKNTASSLGKITENTWLGFQNGIKSAGQTIGRAITNTQADRADFWNKQNEEMLKKIAEKNPEEKERIEKTINNPLISGEQIRKESEITTSKIQKEKEKNVQKIQENANSINNPVGKYLAGNIVPAIGQMAPGLIGGGAGTTYFISSATGNYYDDAKQRGMSDKEATAYSGTMGIIEGTMESLGAKLTTNVGKQLLKKNLKGALVNYGLDIGENFLEESLVEPISEIVAGATAGKDKANWEDIGQRFLQSGIDGAVTSMITGGLSGLTGKLASNMNKNKYMDIQTGEKLNKGSQNYLNKAQDIISQNSNQNKNVDNRLESFQNIKGFHGTDANFENYSLDNFGKHDEGDFGKAIYFSTDKKTASKYGKNIKENNINLSNPFVINNEQDYQNMWHKLAQEANKDRLTKEEIALIDDKYTSQIDKDYLLYNTLTAEEKSNALQKLGYDGIIDKTYNQIAVFNPNNIANSQETLYNNKESVGGISGEEIRQRNRDVFEQSTNEINTEGKTTINTREGFEKRFKEATNKRITDEDISDNSKMNRKILKDVYDTDVFFIEDNIEFSGGADEKLNLINLTKEIANSKDNNVATGHELFEVIRNTREDIKNEYIEPLIDVVKNDNNFNEVLKKYVDNCETKDKQLLLDNPRYIAKEILFDEAGFMFNEDEFKLGVNKQETDLIRFSNYLSVSKAILQMGLSNIEQKARKSNNIQKEMNTINQLDKMEANIQSLGYKPEIEGKQRKHYKSILESDQVGKVGKEVAEKLLESDTYTPISNVDTLSKANENINRNGADDTYVAFRNKINSNERVTLQDIATGERLIQIFSQNGDMEKVNGLIQDVAILGTELGQQVQAMSLIKKASPEGQLMYLNKIVERTNAKQNTDLKVTDEMSQKILKAKNQTELDDVMTDIAVELGEQLPISVKDKVRSWRYLSMLGNPKTHIKNLGANVFMNITQQVKNKVGGAIEDVVGVTNKNLERTKTLKPANKEQRNFAKQDAEYMKDKIDGGGKYDIKNAIQSNQKQFDNKVLNAVANFNSDMLELEDTIFLKKAYQQALQNYMSANKLTRSDMQDSSILQKAREYASFQAQEATFHQFNSLAQRLTEVENKGGIAGKALEAVLPFKKTPMNIAKEGIEYSPIGLAKSLTYDIAQIRKKTNDYKAKLENGTITEADYRTGVSNLITKTIDSTAKGLTGTSLAILGYALADMGVLKSGNEGEDDEFKEKLGEQEYAIRIGDNTFTLDWISPSAIPMFIGSTVHDLIHSEKEDNSNILNSLMTSSAKAFEPMTDMSMLQGLTSAISSYEQGSSNMIFDLGASAVSSYLGQFVPTALGQVAKTMDDKERDTSSTEKGLAKKVDQFKKQQMAKIPAVSKMLPVRKDVWGNEKVRDSNVLVRAYEVGLAPYNRKKVVEDYTERELLKVFDDTGERAVLPGIPNKDITINQQKYRLTAEEYNKAKESFGKTSKSMLDSLVKKNEYKNLSDEQKAEAINNIYSYAKEKIKVDYAKNKKQDIETSTLYNILTDLKENGGNQNDYLSYISKIEGLEKQKEKNQILSSSNYSQATKSIIYRNTTGKEDELYNNVLGKMNIDMNEYLKYKLQELESDKEDDGTTKGKSISGSKKIKVYNYVSNMEITRDQKLILLGSQYKLDNGERTELANLINKLPNQTKDEKLKLYEKMKGFTVYKNGNVSW